MMVQTREEKIPHTCKEVIRKIMAFKYEQLLSPQNKEASNIMVSGKKKIKSVRSYIPGTFPDSY